ncbi:VF530 family DNA-binding protein [Amphritea sp. HPY]|uniref:VF530 family protein n=1 Tax=Amphritea sp. HPY TaxID=3421652 RepID=UPI003D7CB617
MNDEINYKNNPLHGLSLKDLLIEIVDHYGFEILFAYLNINCFKTKPSIESSVKFLKKTDWAREKVEVFYLYTYKNLPRASSTQFALPPRDRIVPEGQVPGEPAELSFEDAERLREKRAKKAAEHGKGGGHRAGKSYGAKRGGYSSNRDSDDTWKANRKPSGSRDSSDKGDSDASNSDPWGNWKKKH